MGVNGVPMFMSFRTIAVIPSFIICNLTSLQWKHNTLRPRQSGHYFTDGIYKCIVLNKNAWISLKVSLKFVHKVRIDNIPALVQIMAWRWPGDKPLSEPIMVSLLTHICVTRPQWVKHRINSIPSSLPTPSHEVLWTWRNLPVSWKGVIWTDNFAGTHFANGVSSVIWICVGNFSCCNLIPGWQIAGDLCVIVFCSCQGLLHIPKMQIYTQLKCGMKTKRLGVTFCFMNLPLGPRWVQKSLNLQPCDFCHPRFFLL